MPTTVLVLDDDPTSNERTRRALTRNGWSVSGAADLTSARAILDQTPCAVIVTELRVDRCWAFDFLGELKEAHPKIQVWIATDYPSVATAVRAVKAGCDAYLAKPVDPEAARDLLSRVRDGGTVPALEPEWPSLDRTIWEFINQVLSASDTMSEAARRLRLDRRSLRRMLAKFPPAH
jgi:two-component system, response regulator RegA